MNPCIAFVAADDVVKAFEELLTTMFWLEDDDDPFCVQKQLLLTYFESTYIGSRRGLTQSRKKPLFEISLWNMFDLTKKSESTKWNVSSNHKIHSSKNISSISDIPRTNNHVEGWHNSINSFIGCQHPKIFPFLNKIMTEQDSQDLNIIQIDAGENPMKWETKYERLDARLMNLLTNYEKLVENSFMPYLDAISHNSSV